MCHVSLFLDISSISIEVSVETRSRRATSNVMFIVPWTQHLRGQSSSREKCGVASGESERTKMFADRHHARDVRGQTPLVRCSRTEHVR